MARTETEVLRELVDIKQKIIDNQKKIINVQRAAITRCTETFRQLKTLLGVNDETEKEG